MKLRTSFIAVLIAVTGAGVMLWWNAIHKPSATTIQITSPQRSEVSHSNILSPSAAALLTPEFSPLAARLGNLAMFGDKLPAADRKAILASITNTPPNGLSKEDWHSLANDMLQVLRKQHPPAPEYTDSLVAMWNDKTLDPTLRDYALQQLREWVADGDSRTSHEERPEKIVLIYRTFLDAVIPGHHSCDPQSTTTGTALLALDEWLPVKTPESSAASPIPDSSAPPFSQIFSAFDFKQLLLTYSANAASHRGVRSTAIQLCTSRGIRDAIPIARSIISDNSSATILRIAAISLLGTLGSAEERALLSTFQQQNARDPILQASLQKALSDLSHQP